MNRIIQLLLLLCLPFYSYSQTEQLEDFEPLIGGEWHMGNSYQTFEWGVGKLSVISRSYFVLDGESTLVSEGYWFWHPGEKLIKGFFTAINMPMVFIDYTTRFDGSKMINHLVTFDKDGLADQMNYVEIMNFNEPDSYHWTLYTGKDSKQEVAMEGTYSRKN